MEGDYDDWEPPSESEMKLLQARRERSDKISKLMGDYLLKGYKMLGITCAACDLEETWRKASQVLNPKFEALFDLLNTPTILLQTRQGVNYCIACSELDSDGDKDNPVLNQAAALALAREREVVCSLSGSVANQASVQMGTLQNSPQLNTSPSECVEISSTNMMPENLQQASFQGINASANASALSAFSQAPGHVGDRDSQKYVNELLAKMDWAIAELRGTQSIEHSLQLCQLIRSCAETVSCVRTALES